MEIVLAIIALFAVVKLFFSGKKESTPEEIKAKQQQDLLNKYKCLDKHPNPNQENLISTVFSIAQEKGSFWCVSFTRDHVLIEYKDGSKKTITMSQLGYTELSLHKYIEGGGFLEFPYRLKRAAENRGYLYWAIRKSGYAKGSSYTSYDGGNSYSRDDFVGEYISSVCVCSKEYYQKYHPYEDPDNKKKLKQL